MQGRLIDGRYHGIAVACFIEGSGAGPKETARLELESDGTVAVYVGSAAVGQGLETVMAQIAADRLGMPLDQVRVLHGSTPYLQEGYGAFASRSTILGGSAVFEGAKALLEKIRVTVVGAASAGGAHHVEVRLVGKCARRRDLGRSRWFALRGRCERVAARLCSFSPTPTELSAAGKGAEAAISPSDDNR